MKTFLVSILITVSLGLVVIADEPSQAEDSASSVYRITAAKPNELAMEYAFWPPITQQIDANAMPMFSRAVLMFVLQDPNENDSPIMKLYDERKASAWTPAKSKKYEQTLRQYQNILGELDYATNCMRVDYRLRTRPVTPGEIVTVELPEIQLSRMLARLLVVRGTMEMHNSRWQDFTRTMQAMFRLVEMVSLSETCLIGQLVGLAIAEEAHGLLTDAWAIPGCPSFRNAMLAVPDSIFDLVDDLKLEITESSRLFPQLAELPDEPIGETEANARLRQWFDDFSKLASESGLEPSNHRWSEFQTNGLISSLSKQAKDFLLEGTQWKNRIEELSPSEMVLRASSHDLLQLVQQALAAASLPLELRSDAFARFEESFAESSSDGRDRWPSRMVMNILMPATAKANDAGRRGLHRHRGLIAVEAIRLAASDSLPEAIGGTLPPIEPEHYERIRKRKAILHRPYAVDSDREKNYWLELVR